MKAMSKPLPYESAISGSSHITILHASCGMSTIRLFLEIIGRDCVQQSNDQLVAMKMGELTWRIDALLSH